MAEQRPHDFLGEGAADLEKQPSHITIDESDDDLDDHSDHGRSPTPDDSDEILDGSGPEISKEKSRKSRISGDLNRLYAVKSRLSTRGWPEPPPPPDGGVQAWTQVACVCSSHISFTRCPFPLGPKKYQPTCYVTSY